MIWANYYIVSSSRARVLLLLSAGLNRDDFSWGHCQCLATVLVVRAGSAVLPATVIKGQEMLLNSTYSAQKNPSL